MVPGTANAAQQPSRATLTPAEWVTTDSKQPYKSITTGDARVGAWRDDKHHIGKSYFTFDITRFKSTQLFTASLRTPEKAANDCTKPRSTQLWVVKPQDNITWAHQPWEITNVAPTANEDCVSPWVTWNVAEPIKKALERGKTEITFALRIAEQFQGKVEYGRTYDSAAVLSTTFNTPPGVPTDLKVGNGTCDAATNFHYEAQPAVSAIVHDADGTYGLEGRLAFWPVATPEQRVETGPLLAGNGSVSGWFPAGMVVDGGVYAFAARTEDGFVNSAWSAPCQFTADFTPPATTPAISSTTYRENGGPPGDGGQGLAGDFTFDAKGDKDIIAFEYSGLGIGSGRVNADAPGGKATITVTPATDGPVVHLGEGHRQGRSPFAWRGLPVLGAHDRAVRAASALRDRLAARDRVHRQPGRRIAVRLQDRRRRGADRARRRGPHGTQDAVLPRTGPGQARPQGLDRQRRRSEVRHLAAILHGQPTAAVGGRRPVGRARRREAHVHRDAEPDRCRVLRVQGR
ncbi:hypothetical protein FXN61_13140 [Lentzea sp. PSKA42]|uniref:DNRLRE domain-containing protein n=1 Tax=Lentzea indica TaxID=2604800 RepID=A0ABX1FFI2_9PSEU|nr:hypothetical protein [Lentzea indica]NKE57729.1 hypothetical protein [Lentzea indica]